MNFDGILLDIDGTIWNTTEIVADAWNTAIQKNNYSIKITAEVLRSEFGKTMDMIAEDLFSSVRKEEQKRLLDDCCEQEQRALKTNTKKITYDGVFETIQRIAETHKIFIVSNCQKGYVELVMDKTGITPYITDHECFGNTGERKAINITRVIDRNGIKNPVYVGDTQGDCDACREASVPFIWAAYGFGKADSYFASIQKFSELEKII